MNEEPKADHREFLYMGIGWMLMDLRQDIEAGNMFFGGYDWKDIVERLAGMEGAVKDYADEHFPVARVFDPEPQPGDGPEYHAEHAYWLTRQNGRATPRVIDSVHDLPWFEDALKQSREVLDATAPESWPSWYREYRLGVAQ